MTFLDVRFPTNISYGSSGGPAYNTSVVVAGSGKEQRNANWDFPRCEFDVAYGVRGMGELEDLLDIFHIATGKAHTFRFKDHSDFKSCKLSDSPHFEDQSIGTGDGITTVFQLYKIYTFGTYTRRSRKITKPVLETVSVGLDGIEQDSGYSIDHSTGEITFDSAPSDGTKITAGFEFDVEVRFDTDSLPINLEEYNSGTVDVPVIEIKR